MCNVADSGFPSFSMHTPGRCRQRMRRVPSYNGCQNLAIYRPRQSYPAIIQFPTVYVVNLQFCTRAEIMKASEKSTILYYILYIILYIILYYYYYYYYYYYVFRKNICSFLLICELINRDRFLINAKCSALSSSTRVLRICFSFDRRVVSAQSLSY